jgi:hypothetical protein
MFALLCSLIRLFIIPSGFQEIALENLALRQQLIVFKRHCPRPRLRKADRLFWLCLSNTWKDWRRALIIVKPETVVSWHRKGFRLFWTWISRSKRSGRPETSPEIRGLIRKMAAANPLWGAPRIHGELLKLGIQVDLGALRLWAASEESETAFPNLEDLPRQSCRSLGFDGFLHRPYGYVSRLVWVGGLGPPSAQRSSFQRHGASNRRLGGSATPRSVSGGWCAAIHDPRPRSSYGEGFRDCAVEMGITEVLTAPQSPWQNAFAERLIGSVRRDCLDHVIILGEKHLRKILRAYFEYYQKSRTHLSLGKDPPCTRTVQPPEVGAIVEIAEVGGLHHRYERRAA